MSAPASARVSNDAIVEVYDRIATPYDWVITHVDTGTRRRAIERLELGAGAIVLEIGCGPGHALGALAARVGPDGYVLGLDAAPGMLDRARRHVEQSDQADRIGLLLGDARALPVPADSVDAVLVEDTLELFSPVEIETVVAECARVLAADGRLGVVTMERSGVEDDPFVRVYEWLFEHLPGYDRIGCRPIYARQALAEGGFEIERRERRRRGYVWPAEILIARPA
ncbi:class I SAM-dependent methyltransferase [Haloarchaeobius amylolyticus]|uniref:Class I SAM-dependent methyltransferase n=1 Tax=Haloarchaeobius amylolyticus TaxID=1198296 RepID=A0ABD6BK71_9EURY